MKVYKQVVNDNKEHEGGGGPNPTPSFVCLDVVEDSIFFILIARCSH